MLKILLIVYMILNCIYFYYSSKFGVTYTNKDGVLKQSGNINFKDVLEFKITKKDNPEIWKYLKKNRIIEVAKLKEFKEFENLKRSIKNGYIINFVVTNEEEEEELSDTIFLGEKVYGEYEEKNIEFLETLIGEIEIILENVAKKKFIEKQNRELTERVYDLMSLNLAAQMITSTLEKEEIFKSSLDMVTEIARAKEGALVYYNDEKKEIEIKEVRGREKEGIEGRTVKINSFELDYLRREEGLLSILNLTDKNHPMIKFYKNNRDFFKDLSIYLFIPLHNKSNFLGFILLGAKQIGGRYTENNKDMLKTLVSHIASSLYNAKLYDEAITDGMTKLYLHRYFKIRLAEEVAAGERYKRELSLIMIDIDHFKKFNDTYGHQTGDKVLKNVANILKKSTRASDLVARYGGEEFVIILPETLKKGGEIVAENLRKRIEEAKIKDKDTILKVTVSFGVSTIDYQKDMTIDDLIKEADLALYYSKENGRNRVTHYLDIKE
ncbi:MAG: hypothetical protein B6I28_05710 [Fusobacteriia bacterium 4572_132]|nr:MAG: hypothetical protein B6I28_05710 [Fusobacteriia bacterium 4572_132]